MWLITVSILGQSIYYSIEGKDLEWEYAVLVYVYIHYCNIWIIAETIFICSASTNIFIIVKKQGWPNPKSREILNIYRYSDSEQILVIKQLLNCQLSYLQYLSKSARTDKLSVLRHLGKVCLRFQLFYYSCK